MTSCVITWETYFAEINNPHREVDDVDNAKNLTNDTSTQNEIFNDVDLRSTALHEIENAVPTEKNTFSNIGRRYR